MLKYSKINIIFVISMVDLVKSFCTPYNLAPNEKLKKFAENTL